MKFRICFVGRQSTLIRQLRKDWRHYEYFQLEHVKFNIHKVHRRTQKFVLTGAEKNGIFKLACRKPNGSKRSFNPKDGTGISTTSDGFPVTARIPESVLSVPITASRMLDRSIETVGAREHT